MKIKLLIFLLLFSFCTSEVVDEGIFIDPVDLKNFGFEDPKRSWLILLFIYSSIASLIPVWILLQPRDYINSHQLIV